MKKIVLILMMIILMYSLETSVYAYNGVNTLSSSATEMVFTSEIGFSSQYNLENMSLLGDELEQIVLCSKKMVKFLL